MHDAIWGSLLALSVILNIILLRRLRLASFIGEMRAYADVLRLFLKVLGRGDYQDAGTDVR